MRLIQITHASLELHTVTFNMMSTTCILRVHLALSVLLIPTECSLARTMRNLCLEWVPAFHFEVIIYWHWNKWPHAQSEFQ